MADDHVRVDIMPELAGADAPAPEPESDAAEESQDAPAPEAADEPAPAPERPAWLPEKFQTVEDLAAAYNALERRQGQQPPAEGEASETARGLLDMGELRPYFDEYGTTGRLAEESYGELEQKFGLPRDVVDDYITGQIAKSEMAAGRVYEAVGGRAAYDEMLKGAFEAAKAGRIPEAQLEAYNRTLATNDVDAIIMAARGLQASIGAPAKPKTRPLQGHRPTASGPTPFANSKQITAAIRDPRYKSDPAYRDEVEARLRETEAFGQGRG